MARTGEFEADLLAAVVKALEPYDIPTDRAWTDAERIEPAQAVLRALGFEQAGWWEQKSQRYRHLSVTPEPHRPCEPLFRLTLFGRSAS